MPLLQDNRLLKVTTALGAGVAVLRRLAVTEALDQPYLIQGELLTAEIGTEVAPKDILGTQITCTVDFADGQRLPRHFHGVVTAFGRLPDEQRDFRRYRFEAAPAMALLTRAMDCRIFQQMSVNDIIAKVAQDRGIDPPVFLLPLTGQREYCTQFNETDFDFVCRLLDESGSSYFFDNTEGGDGWVVTGDKGGFAELEGDPLVVRGEQDRADALTNWSSLSTVQPAKHRTWDFDSLKPDQLKMAEAPTTLPTTGLTSGLEVYRWPGGDSVRPDGGKGPADLRMRRNEASAETWTGRSEWPALAAGKKAGITDGGQSKRWLLTAVTHEAFDETHLTGQRSRGYSNSFACVAGTTDWRSPVRRARPVIAGLQSAIVTGPSGEEQHCDAQGRIKVHFLWDHRDDKKNETSSCYVRVMQPFAGSWGGAWFLPRIGDEVLIAFLDGDPDRPVCVGSLFNDPAKPFWALPGHITRSGFRSRSTKQGSRDNANILGFDDLKGSEQFYVQAEKNYLELVKNEKKVTVKGNEIRDVTGESQDQSDGKRTTTVKGDESLTVKQGNRTTTIQQGDETHEVTQGKRTTTINGNETLEVKTGNREATIKMGNETLTVSMGNMTVKVSMGNISIKADLGSITIEAMQGVTIKGGPTSTIEVAPTGITFKALKISTAADLMNETKGAIEQQSGQGMQKVGGAITMIG